MSVSDLAIPQAQNAFVLISTLNGDGSCLAIGGSWNPGRSTCTMNGFTLNNADKLTIDPSNTLSNTSTITINSGTDFTLSGVLANSGTLVVISGTRALLTTTASWPPTFSAASSTTS
jgi:hypothetical protein